MLTLNPPARAGRVISHIPSLLLMELISSGKIPPIPHEPRSGGLGWRMPTLIDLDSVKWLAAWSGRQVGANGFNPLAGLASYKDYYRFHDAADVREICSIRGSKRSIVELTQWMRDDAEIRNRKLVGSFETLDYQLSKLMGELGGVHTTLSPWEYSPQ